MKTKYSFRSALSVVFGSILVSVAVLILLMSTNAQSPGRNVRGMNLPESVGPFTLRQIIDNERENPGLGSTVYYNAPGAKISVYVYDHSLKLIPDGIESEEIKSEFAVCKRAIKEAYPDAQLMVAAEKFNVGGVGLLHSAHQFTEAKPGTRTVMISHLYLGTRQGNFIKIRASYPADNPPPANEKMVTTFVEGFFAAVTARGKPIDPKIAPARDWVVVNRFGDSDCSVDQNSVQRFGESVRVIVKYTLTPPGTDKHNGKKISEMLNTEEYDLSRGTFRVHNIQFRYVDGSLGDSLAAELQWKPASAGNEKTLNFLKQLKH